jgi:hypothetical protein
VEVAQDGEVGKEAQMGLPAAMTRCSGPRGGRWCWSARVPTLNIQISWKLAWHTCSP